jgi:hypothetical protein
MTELPAIRIANSSRVGLVIKEALISNLIAIFRSSFSWGPEPAIMIGAFSERAAIKARLCCLYETNLPAEIKVNCWGFSNEAKSLKYSVSTGGFITIDSISQKCLILVLTISEFAM